ncbi:DUF4179 domain-containing protein [Lederbergia citrisecunda]|uniref:DUF4179 domain-containing protein n=1 Tax=Lederbergia citrisecunda TaxID=2833583 RepID=UPI003D26EAAA
MKKDVYDHLNDMKMDINQFEVEEVSEAEKSRVMMDLKRKIRKPKPVRWRKMAAAASITIGLSSAALFGLSFTSFAQEIPIIGQVFKWFNDDGFYQDYDEHANTLAMTQEDNGIRMTVNEAVFDGKTLYITYDLITETDLGETPWLDGMPKMLDESISRLVSAQHNVKKINDTHYAGITTATLWPDYRVEEGSFEFNINGILMEPRDDAEVIPGNWKFQFDLKATDNKEQVVKLTSAKNGVAVNIKRAVFTPMSFIIYYDERVSTEQQIKWDFISVDIEVRDDLGNIYANEHNGGFDSQHSNTFEKLNPKATKLIITPSVRLAQRDGTNENGSYYRNEGSTAPMEEFELDEIVIEIEK